MKASLILYIKLVAPFVLLTLVVGGSYAFYGVQRFPPDPAWHVPAADAERGKVLIQQYGCSACHTVPGVPGARGRVGPRLDQLSTKIYIAGVLPNSPQNLVFWIQHPQEVDPRTAMPDLGVSEKDARDIAAHLYSDP